MSEKTVVVVDQFTKRVGTVNRRGWYPIGSDPTIEDSNSWDKVTVLGAVTDDGDSFYCWTEDNLKTQHGIWLLEALKDRFGDDLVVFLDRASYFYTRDLWEHVSVDAGDRTVSDSFGRTLAADVFPKIPRIEVAGTIQKHYQIVSKPVFKCF